MKKTLLAILAATVLFGTASVCPAEDELKPVLTASFAGYERLLADINAIGQLGGNPALGQSLDMMAKMMTQGLAGLDTKRPWGAVVLTDGEKFVVCGFLPVTELKKLMEVTKANPQLGGAIKLEGDVYEIGSGGSPVYATQKGDWAIISDKSENLDKAPADPLKLLGDLPGRYNLAVLASTQNLPKEFREQLLAQIRAGAEVGMQEIASRSSGESAAQLDAAKQTVQQLTDLVNDMDSALLGWNIDAKGGKTYLDLELTARSGTKLADQFAQIKPGKSNFTGLLMPRAAVTASSVGTLTDAQVAQAKSALAMMKKSLNDEIAKQDTDEEAVKLAAQLLDDLTDVMQKTVAAKKTDFALAVLLEPKAYTMIAGSTIAEGEKLQKAVASMAAAARKDKDLGNSIKLSDESYQGIPMYVLTIPTPEEGMVPLVGETLDIVVGVAADKVFAAMGRDAAATLKKAIDQSQSDAGKEVPPLRIAVAMTPIAKFVAEMGDDDASKAQADVLAKMLEGAGDKDHFVLTANPIPMGVRVRLEAEEGLLKLLGATGVQVGAPGGGAPAPK